MGLGLPGGFGGGGGDSDSPFERAQAHVNNQYAMKSTSGGGFAGTGSGYNKYGKNTNKKTDSDKLTKEEFERRKKALEQCARSYQITISVIWCIVLVLMMACSDSGWWIAILLGIGIFFTWACGKEVNKYSSDIRLLELVYESQKSQTDDKKNNTKNNNNIDDSI